MRSLAWGGEPGTQDGDQVCAVQGSRFVTRMYTCAGVCVRVRTCSAGVHACVHAEECVHTRAMQMCVCVT